MNTKIETDPAFSTENTLNGVPEHNCVCGKCPGERCHCSGVKIAREMGVDDSGPRPCDCGMQTGETCHCPPDVLSVPAITDAVRDEGFRIMRELRERSEAARKELLASRQETIWGPVGDTIIHGGRLVHDEIDATKIEAEHQTGEIYATVADMMREPAQQWARRTLSPAERNELAEEGASILAVGYGVDGQRRPWEMQGCSDVKEQSGARRVDPNSPALCGITEAQRGPILRLIETACRRAVAEDRAAREKDKQPGIEPLFTPGDIEALAGIARRTDEARRMDLEARTKRLDALPDGPYSEQVLKVDLVSVFVEDGMPTVLLVPAGGKSLKARLAPALLGSLLAGLGLIVGSLVPPRR